MTKGRVAGSSLSYPVAQNIAPQDLFVGHYADCFTKPKSRIQLLRLHKTTIKTEMNKDNNNNKKKHSDRLIVRVLLTYSRVFPNHIGNSYNSPRYCCSVFHRDSDCHRS